MPSKSDPERKALRRHPGYEPTDPPPAAPTPETRARSTKPPRSQKAKKARNSPKTQEAPKTQDAPETQGASEAHVASPEGGAERQAAAGVARIEALLGNGDWSRVAELLGQTELDRLSPRDALLYALARHESGVGADVNAMTRLAIDSVARLLEVPASSEIALVVAKRLLRKTPVSWARRPAPPARVSILIVLIVLAVSCALGWFLSSTHVKWQLW